MAWTYMLECSDGSYYVGSTIDLERRVAQHQSGAGAAYTRHRLPVRLVWSAQFDSIRAAFDFEKRVQNWGRAKREALIDGRFDLLPALASRSWSARNGLWTRPTTMVAPASMPWDVPHVRVADPDDPWAPLVPVRGGEGDGSSEVDPTHTRIVPEEWSRDGC